MLLPGSALNGADNVRVIHNLAKDQKRMRPGVKSRIALLQPDHPFLQKIVILGPCKK